MIVSMPRPLPFMQALLLSVRTMRHKMRITRPAGRTAPYLIMVAVLVATMTAPLLAHRPGEGYVFVYRIWIGGHLAVPPLQHHRAYGSRTTAVRLGYARDDAATRGRPTESK